jgi:hypothetical protein
MSKRTGINAEAVLVYGHQAQRNAEPGSIF